MLRCGVFLCNFSRVFFFFLVLRRLQNCRSETSISPLLQSEVINQPKENNREKKTKENLKHNACKIADQESPISTLVQSAGPNQPKENNREENEGII